MLESRAYQSTDYKTCLSLFDSNVPEFFALHEREDFSECLKEVNPINRPYILLIENGQLRASGGLIINATKQIARMTWGMVDNKFHNQGLGTILTEARIKLAKNYPGIRELGLETSQHTYGFYERFGFSTLDITKNGFADGLDRYDMSLIIKSSH